MPRGDPTTPLTIRLRPQTLQALKDRAEAKGLKVTAYASKLIEKNFAPRVPPPVEEKAMDVRPDQSPRIGLPDLKSIEAKAAHLGRPKPEDCPRKLVHRQGQFCSTCGDTP